jgi:hypothetical protein
VFKDPWTYVIWALDILGALGAALVYISRHPRPSKDADNTLEYGSRVAGVYAVGSLATRWFIVLLLLGAAKLGGYL